MKYIIKQMILVALIFTIIGVIIISVINKQKVVIEEVKINEPLVQEQKPTPLCYTDSMEEIDCEILSEKLFTEKYIRDNIATLATNKPVLGGSWYVISAIANQSTHTAEVVYEDGHIQSKASIIYTYSKNPQSITVTKFEVVD